MSTLRQHLQDLAATFANSVLTAIRSASIEDLLAQSGAAPRRGPGRPPSAHAAATPARRSRGGRLARRSSADIAKVIDRVVGLLRQSPKGLRAEQIRSKLGLRANEMPRPLKDALASGRLGKSGQKRATTYFIKGGAAPARAAGRSSAKKK
jgi:hypothetical protein